MMNRTILIFLMVFSTSITSHANNSASAQSIRIQIQKKLLARSLELASQDRLTKALEILNSKDLAGDEFKNQRELFKGRIYFNLKRYTQALEAYNKIDKNSEQWLSSVEERGWVKIYLGQYNQAIADTHTLMSPLFSDVVSPEAYYLSAFTAHQVCDFTRVFKIVSEFKKTASSKIRNLEAKPKNSKTSVELKHFADVITQLHRIEADAIQRIYLDQKLKGERSSIGGVAQNDPYALQFPYDEDDVWIDEVDQLKVDAKNCPQLPNKVVAL